jgi:hypothetical protein
MSSALSGGITRSPCSSRRTSPFPLALASTPSNSPIAVDSSFSATPSARTGSVKRPTNWQNSSLLPSHAAGVNRYEAGFA